MSFVIAAPEMMTAAATDMATIGSNVSAAHMMAAARTTSVIPAAVDEVSTGIARLVSQHATDYQALAAKAAAFHEQFMHHLTAGAFSYASIEAAPAASLGSLLSLVPPGILINLGMAGIDAGLFLIAGIVIGYLAFGILLNALILRPLGWS